MHPSLKTYIERHVSLSAQELAHFEAQLTLKKYPKKEFLLHAGDVCKKRFFILEGLTTSFYIDKNGNEQITLFGKEHWWVMDMESYVLETPAKVNIQALEATTVLEISKSKLEYLFEAVPKIERLFRRITENWLIAQQRNNHFYMKASSGDRYDHMVRHIPNFVQRVPQYMIASYLDITPEHLSTIRKMHALKRS